MSEATREAAGHRKQRRGRIVSDAMEKTVVVSVERQMSHPLYGKQVKRQKKYHAHDETNEFRKGDLVVIEETRPLSRKKRWRVVELLERPVQEG
jgi:small subunit ribosomal protein S17